MLLRLIGQGLIMDWALNEVQKGMEEKMPDYYVFVLPFEQSFDAFDEPIQIQVFHEKDFTEIQYEGLKKLVMDSLKCEAPGEPGAVI